MNWQDFNWIDFTILGVVGISTLVSLVRGFIREAISLVIWVAAFGLRIVFRANLLSAFLAVLKVPVSA